ncbi:MAG: FlgD immunoglobulin-like domain containing protein [Candidatus Eiseniibacteriota bacterium]
MTPHRGRAEVNLYDVTGRKVKTLLSEVVEAGAHSVRWNRDNQKGNRVAAGVYFYRLRFEETQTSRKVVVVD